MLEEQMSLDLGMPPPQEVLYFALRPDVDAAREMVKVGRRCRERHGLSGCLAAAERLHVSLAPAVSRRGFRRDDTAAAFRAAASVRAEPFTVAFGRLCTYKGRDKRPVVLCCDDGGTALTALRNALRDELVKAGLWRGPPRFEPHVTLFRGNRIVPETYLEAPILWTVQDFVLVRALFGTSRYVDLARWPLRNGVWAE